MTFGQTAKSVLATVAPLLGTAIGGPFGGLAGALLSKALGTTDPKAMEAAITSTDPDILLKLKQAENDFTIQLKSLEISEEKLTFDDIAGARAMQTAVRDPTVARLAWLVIGGFLLISLVELAAMLVFPDKVRQLPDAAWLLIGSVLGYLSNEAKQAGSFYFGSSAGSQAKDATISDLAKSP